MNELLNQVGRQVRVNESNTSAEVFADVARFLLLGKGAMAGAEIAKARGRQRAANILEHCALHLSDPGGPLRMKAPVAAGNTTDPTWAAPLATFNAVASAWLGSLRSISAFDRLLPDMAQIPLRHHIGIVTLGANGFVAGEGQVKTVSRLELAASELMERKACAWLVVTNELARIAGTIGSRLLDNELRAAVAAVTDEKFIEILIDGLSPIGSAGSTVAAVRTDLAAALAAIDVDAKSKLFIITTAKIAKAWAMSCTESGDAAFPDMGPQGGTIAKVPVLVSFGCPDGHVIVVDAARIAANGETVGLEILRHATVEMAAPADSPTTGGTVLTNLFQTSMVALAATRWFGAERIADNSVAVIDGVSYSGDSPA